MLTASLPMLPPPASSLLPRLNERPNTESSRQTDGQSFLQAQQQRRVRGHPHATNPRSQLAMLAYDESVIAQRKLAIRFYGYSWLKPAGCTKTMLGRQEEDLEREEAERQLREIELQERNAAEMEEAERRAQLSQQAAREAIGEDVGEGERDLDEDVPDMDAQDEYEDESDEDEDENEDAEDLDDEVPEAHNDWTYDTTRDPDTESEGEQQDVSFAVMNLAQQRQGIPTQAQFTGAEEQDLAEQEAIAEAMLNEDELGEYANEENLDDGVPDADDDGGWEHTDTELEESDMDISIMPPGATAHHISPHIPMPPPSLNTSQRQQLRERQSMASEASTASSSGIRRTSGNIVAPLPPSASSRPPPRRGLGQAPSLLPNFTPDQFGSDFSVSALISTGNSEMSADSARPPARAWLDPASARRNLFGARSIHAEAVGSSNTSGAAPHAAHLFDQAQDDNSQNTMPAPPAPRQVSSGGLFTPSPQQQHGERMDPGMSSMEPPVSRTRSGRVIGGNRGGRRP